MANLSFTFSDKVAVVTGASAGIGLATANLLAESGATVFALSRSHTDEWDGGVTWVPTDVSDQVQVKAAVATAAAKSGHIDVCVANAGVGLVENFATTTEASWRALLDVNLLGVMYTWQAAVSCLRPDGKGRLLATSSAAGVRGEAGTPAYSASKAGLKGLVEAVAIEQAASGVTVNAVAPGEIDTELNRRGRVAFASRSGTTAAGLLAELVANNIPAGRLGTAAEVATLIAFLATEEAGYITGQTIVIDGGQLLV